MDFNTPSFNVIAPSGSIFIPFEKSFSPPSCVCCHISSFVAFPLKDGSLYNLHTVHLKSSPADVWEGHSSLFTWWIWQSFEEKGPTVRRQITAENSALRFQSWLEEMIFYLQPAVTQVDWTHKDMYAGQALSEHTHADMNHFMRIWFHLCQEYIIKNGVIEFPCM